MKIKSATQGDAQDNQFADNHTIIDFDFFINNPERVAYVRLAVPSERELVSKHRCLMPMNQVFVSVLSLDKGLNTRAFNIMPIHAPVPEDAKINELWALKALGVDVGLNERLTKKQLRKRALLVLENKMRGGK